MAFTDRYDEQVRTAINGRLRGAGKRLSAYCASVVDGEDIDSLADDFAAGVDDSVDDGVSDACCVAVAMCLALSGEASRRKKKPVGKSLITAAGAAALSAYLLRDDRVRAKDIMKGFASQTKEAVSLLPDGTKEERAGRLAEYLKNPSRIVADAGEESIIHKQPAIMSRLRRAITTEIATAYRVVEHSIWNILPFVVGQEIRLGKKHPVPDICDELQGIYPKDFKFTGWHPWCRCFARPIFSWESDKVTDMPGNFDAWLQKNAERIERAAERDTLPVWIKNNGKYVGVKQAAQAKQISEPFRGNPRVRDAMDVSGFNVTRVFPNGGKILVHKLVPSDDSDYTKLIEIATFFAATGKEVRLTPKMKRPPQFEYASIYGSLIGTKYENKCPDFLVGDLWYEHEGFISRNPKNAFRNMMRDGLLQSNRLIIDRPELTERFMRRSIIGRIDKGEDIEEVWIRESNGSLTLLYKKRTADNSQPPQSRNR